MGRVTVIPATTVYYEDEYVKLTTYTKGEDGNYTTTSASKRRGVPSTASCA